MPDYPPAAYESILAHVRRRGPEVGNRPMRATFDCKACNPYAFGRQKDIL